MEVKNMEIVNWLSKAINSNIIIWVKFQVSLLVIAYFMSLILSKMQVERD